MDEIEYGELKVWTNDEDWFVARSAEEALAFSVENYGDCEESASDYELVPPASMIRISNEGRRPFLLKTAARWAATSPAGLLCTRNF